MVRGNSRRIAAVLCAVALASGCGGTTDDGLSSTSKAHATTLTGFGAATASRVYFGMTNTVAVDGRPTIATFDLTAGSLVELEIATRDSSPLVFELHRVRRDGTTELLSPVHATSGFHLAQLEASSTGTFVLFFPAADNRATNVIVHLDCKDSASRCAPARQPNESCTLVFTCDEGLVCVDANGQPPPYVGEGTCVVQPDAPNIP
jgi:hypothetical protein